MDDAPAIRIQQVSRFRGPLQVLKDVTLDVPRGQVVALLGPSGAGKSTLLRCINHLETIDGGKIFVEGELIGYRERGDALHELPDPASSRQRQRIGMVFQSFNLFRHLTALDNVMAGPIHVLGMARGEAQARAQALLAQVGLAEKARSYPNQLSGGQQQRVAIARAGDAAARDAAGRADQRARPRAVAGGHRHHPPARRPGADADDRHTRDGDRRRLRRPRALHGAGRGGGGRAGAAAATAPD